MINATPNDIINAVNAITNNPLEIEVQIGETFEEVEIETDNCYLVLGIRKSGTPSRDFQRTSFGDPDTKGEVRTNIEVRSLALFDSDWVKLNLTYESELYLISMVENLCTIV